MRKWVRSIPPKTMNNMLHCFHGVYTKDMDRCWESDDGYSVASRLLNTEWGKVEHVTIVKRGGITFNGEKDVSWKVKQEIKDELFGKKRVAIEVFPTEDRMIDTADVYHLWVFEKGFRLPFGIHPKEIGLTTPINRGDFMPTQEELEECQEFFDNDKNMA